METTYLGFSVATIVIAACIGFLVVRRVLRWAVKLAIIGALLLAITLGAGFWFVTGWWNASNEKPATPARRTAPPR